MISIPIWTFALLIVLAAPCALLGIVILLSLVVDAIDGVKK